MEICDKQIDTTKKSDRPEKNGEAKKKRNKKGYEKKMFSYGPGHDYLSP